MRKCSRRWLALIAAPVALLGALARASAQRPVELVPRETVYLSALPLAGWIDTPRCDAGGNLYIRFATPPMTSPNGPVTKLSPEGRVVGRFSLDAVPNSAVKEKATVRSIAVDLRGRVYLLLSKEGKTFILRFAEDGGYEDTAELRQPGLIPAKLVAFPTGTLLVSGILQKSATDRVTGNPFTAVFDDTGKLVRELTLHEDASADSSAAASPKTGDRAAQESQGPNAGTWYAAAAGSAVVGDDGNAYLMRRSSPPIIYVIASEGTLLRTLKVVPPAEGLDPAELSEAGGRLVVAFAGQPSAPGGMFYILHYSVYDAVTGEPVADYLPSPELKGHVVCYSPNAFTFLGMGANRQLALTRAVPH